MIFTETNIRGAYIISLEPKRDERGFFARAWCEQELAERDLCRQVAQCNIGFSVQKGTIRGIHWQSFPHEEVKVVRCTRGGLFDVIVDVRPGSPTYGQHHAMELWAGDHKLLYIPTGVGHGYQTLVDETEMFYQTSQSYHAESCDGLRYNDPALGINWPLQVSLVADHDLTWPDFSTRSKSTTPAESAQ
jgi:dTDP-4-dehydrorhamnose 3,5-epimerase